jgi:hypothetical protein
MNGMKARAVFVLVWVSTTVGAVRLLGDVGARAGVALVALGCALLVRAHFRRRRLRVWNGSGEPVFAPGPRRVLLAETGLSAPE